MTSFQESSSLEEAASIVAGLRSIITDSSSFSTLAGSKKRVGDKGDIIAELEQTKKCTKKLGADVVGAPSKKTKTIKPPPMDATGLVFAQPDLKPHPFFYYSDHSLEQDEDPLTPITAAGIVPTFPAKMHAILANPDLADVVAWAPHGRCWRILKPRDFEIRILPKYFEHSKFSSFVRQANGWGFRRISEGPDKNAYYHEYFLRAMPWLCKKMRRPKVAEKKAIDPEMEPDLNAISRLFPVPEGPPTSEVLVLQKTIEAGPRARMPVLWETFNPPDVHSFPAMWPKEDKNIPATGKAVEENVDTPKSSASFGVPKAAALPSNARSSVVARGGHLLQATVPSNPPVSAPPSPQGTVAVTTLLNIDSARDAQIPSNEASTQPPITSYRDQSSAASSESQIAASFVAASNLHAHHIRIMLSNAFVAGMPVSEAMNKAMPFAAAATAARFGVAHGAGMSQLSHNNWQPQSNHAISSEGNCASYNGNSFSPEAIQCLRQIESYRAAGGDMALFSRLLGNRNE